MTIITSFVAKYLNPNTIFRRKQWTWQQSLRALSQNTPIQIRDSPGHNNNSDKKASRNKRSKNTASSNKEPDCWLSSRTITPGFTSVLGAAANIFFSSRALKTTQIHRSHLFLCVCGVFFMFCFCFVFFFFPFYLVYILEALHARRMHGILKLPLSVKAGKHGLSVQFLALHTATMHPSTFIFLLGISGF